MYSLYSSYKTKRADTHSRIVLPSPLELPTVKSYHFVRTKGSLMADTIDMIYLTTNLRECPERSEISQHKRYQVRVHMRTRNSTHNMCMYV